MDLEYGGLQHSTVNPKFLHSNSTSHTWAFGALAELVDNAADPDVHASQLLIDVEYCPDARITVSDNGSGMDPKRLLKMLGFGHSEKVAEAIGRYGNGFKSGSMKLGKDAIVFTTDGLSSSVGLLSQTFLASIGADEVLAPIATWDAAGNCINNNPLHFITQYSPFKTEAEILQQFQKIPGQTGTRIVIYNLRMQEGKESKPEIDFSEDAHDFRIMSDLDETTGLPTHFSRERPFQKAVDVPIDYSLRAYLSVLYMRPLINDIILRGVRVDQRPMVGSLAARKTYTYKPMGSQNACKIVFGFNAESLSLYGMMLYHKNRLIKPYVRVGMQLNINAQGTGVVGVIQCDFLEPTHNKQDFIDNVQYRGLLRTLAVRLSQYWREKIPSYTVRGSVPLRKFIEGLCEANGKSVFRPRNFRSRPVGTGAKRKAEDGTVGPAKKRGRPKRSLPVEPGQGLGQGAGMVGVMVPGAAAASPDDLKGEEGEDSSDEDRIPEDEDESIIVQCENPECLRWRRLPKDVELPELFFCHFNTWDPLHCKCEDPQEPGLEPEEFVDEPSVEKRFLTIEGKQQDILERVEKFITAFKGKMAREKRKLQMIAKEFQELNEDVARQPNVFTEAIPRVQGLGRSIRSAMSLIDTSLSGRGFTVATAKLGNGSRAGNTPYMNGSMHAEPSHVDPYVAPALPPPPQPVQPTEPQRFTTLPPQPATQAPPQPVPAKPLPASNQSSTIVLLQFASQMMRDGYITAEEKGRLKNLVLKGDEGVIAAALVHQEDKDDDELRDTLLHAVRSF